MGWTSHETARAPPHGIWSKRVQRHLADVDEQIICQYAGGRTVPDIGFHFERTLGTQPSHETISNITEAVMEQAERLADPAAQGLPPGSVD